jgi:hypothetical protein
MKLLTANYIGKGKYRLVKDFNLCGIKVPSGFITDVDSVPRIPIVYLMFKNRAIEASVLHDYLYSRKFPRKYADQVYLAAMKKTEVPVFYRYSIYFAVRIFGRFFY